MINGAFRDGWSDQTDGPALQTLAILALYGQLDDPTKAVANAVIAANLNFLQNAYQGKTVNLWEEEYGYSFFARAVQLKCFQEITANAFGIPVPGWLATAIPWLQNALQDHWNANGGYYQSLIPAPGDKAPYDPNSDIVMAAIYGAVAVTDTKLLATAALLRNQWDLASSTVLLPDQRRRSPARHRTDDGPLPRRRLRRRQRPVRDRPPVGGLHVQLRRALLPACQRDHRRQCDPARHQLGRVLQPGGVTASSTPAAAANELRAAGDQMLQAIIFHSDHLELSEQFDASTGYEKSVSNLSWSYASFLSAVRAR